MSDIAGEVKWIPVSAVARALKISRQRVYKLVKEGKLRHVVIENSTLISLRSLNDLIALRAGKRLDHVSDRVGV